MEFWSFVKALVKLTKMAEELIKILFFFNERGRKKDLANQRGLRTTLSDFM